MIEINQTCATGPGCLAGDASGFPVTIAAAGSYRLTSSLSNANANLHTVHVTADDVTLACINTGTGSGISAPGRSRVRVLNGTVRGAGFGGIELGEACRVERVTTEANGARGVLVGMGCVIEGAAALRNGWEGIQTGGSTIVMGSRAVGNGASGIQTAAAGVVLSSLAARNEEDGISTTVGSIVTDSAASSNGGEGIRAGAASSVSRNTSENNAGDQIVASASAVVGNLVRSHDGQGWALNLGSGTLRSGYSQNTILMSGALGLVTGGFSAGDNVCNGLTC